MTLKLHSRTPSLLQDSTSLHYFRFDCGIRVQSTLRVTSHVMRSSPFRLLKRNDLKRDWASVKFFSIGLDTVGEFK
jgi:hypothetical protein